MSTSATVKPARKSTLNLPTPYPLNHSRKGKILKIIFESPNGVLYFNLQIYFVKFLQQEADLFEGRAEIPIMNTHSLKHYFNSLCYKKIYFLILYIYDCQAVISLTELQYYSNLRWVGRAVSIIRGPPTRVRHTDPNKSPAPPNLSKQTFQGM